MSSAAIILTHVPNEHHTQTFLHHSVRFKPHLKTRFWFLRGIFAQTVWGPYWLLLIPLGHRCPELKHVWMSTLLQGEKQVHIHGASNSCVTSCYAST